MQVENVRICLLGDFNLTYANPPYEENSHGIHTARLQALLAYLLLHRRTPQPRHHLAFLFWPDTGEAQALTNLRNLLHKLRMALPQLDCFLQANMQTVQWQPDAPFTLDIADFEATLAQAPTCANLERAVQLYDEPVEVMARVRYRTDTQADETATFAIRFAKGATAQCLVTQAGDGFFNQLDIYGRDGRISLRGVDYLDYAVEVVSHALPAYTEPTRIYPRGWGDPKLAMLTAELTEFAQAINEQRPPAITVSDGRRVLRILDAVIKSDRTGECVRLIRSRPQSIHPADLRFVVTDCYG